MIAYREKSDVWDSVAAGAVACGAAGLARESHVSDNDLFCFKRAWARVFCLKLAHVGSHLDCT